ncbi:CDP-alcohol phosphatidyltransferase family protein [Candidatus Woesearchaeota archaeon]|nr:CDP-alcohol phosphatidyltransferase family protein [Candidatus Woesearchaeota archaeon]
MNLANIITLTRIAFLPLLILLILQETATASAWAMVLLGVAIITDIVDGYVARKRAETTRIGSFLDPFADKILVMGLLLLFVLQGKFWKVPFVFFIVRDVSVGIVRWLASQDDILIPEESYRKSMVYLQYAILFSLLLEDFFWYSSLFDQALMSAVALFVLTAAVLVLAAASILYHALHYGKGAHKHWQERKKVEAGTMVILANPQSSAYNDRYRRHLLRLFAKRRGAEVHYLPAAPNMYRSVEKNIAPTDNLIIAGGDGSFESALNYRPFWNKKLGFFPLGAGNAYKCFELSPFLEQKIRVFSLRGGERILFLFL